MQGQIVYRSYSQRVWPRLPLGDLLPVCDRMKKVSVSTSVCRIGDSPPRVDEIVCGHRRAVAPGGSTVRNVGSGQLHSPGVCMTAEEECELRQACVDLIVRSQSCARLQRNRIRRQQALKQRWNYVGLTACETRRRVQTARLRLDFVDQGLRGW